MLAGCSHVVNSIGDGTHQLELAAPGGASVKFDVPYLVLELADGSLAELLLNRARLPWQARLELYRDLVKGVHQMHLGGVVHRDVKSDNSLIFSRPQGAKIADLGRSRNTVAQSRFVAEAYEAGRGDLRFAPPELLWKCGTDNPDDMARVDLFLLGSLLFELATGVAITQVAPSTRKARARVRGSRAARTRSACSS
jgi:serine/threonine protein kinase